MSKLTSFSLSSQQHKNDTNVNNTTNLYFGDGQKERYVHYPNPPVIDPKSLSPTPLSPASASNQQYIDRATQQDETHDADDSVVVVKTIDNKTEQMYLSIIEAFGSILKEDNKTMLTNIIDMSGKVIIKAESLLKIIALACNTEPENVVINYLDEEVGCLHKFNPLKKIASIKVDNKDMFIQYNSNYNMIQNTFNISLEKCVVSEANGK